MLNARFPTDISFGSVGGPEYITDVIKTRAGYEQRIQKKVHATRRYNVAYAIKSHEQLERVRAFFMNARGRARAFLFQDPLDHGVSEQWLGVGDGIQKAFALVKSYAAGEGQVLRPLFYPLLETLHINVGGEENTAFSFKEGQIIFDTPPPENAPIMATFDFDILARFDTDYLPERLDGHGYVSITDLPIVEVLEDK